jgi:hypothetical protein
VKAGTCVVQSTSATGGCFTVTLTAATDLDIAASDPTNPRMGRARRTAPSKF